MKMRWLLIFITSLCLSACFPVYKTLQPSVLITVVGPDNKPVADAEVMLITRAYPHRDEHSRDVKQTGADGIVRFDTKKKLVTESLMIHGGYAYFWNWCVRKEGYATYLTQHEFSSGNDTQAVVILQPGESKFCPKQGPNSPRF
jgi:hypothetical protein